MKKKDWEKEFDNFISSFVFYGEPVVGTVLHNETKEFISNLLKEQRKETYKKGYKDGLKNVVGWSKQYEKMMIEKL